MRRPGTLVASQLSFYSSEARPPRIRDLAGALCGPGQAVGFGADTAARLSVVVADPWRARALAALSADRGVRMELTRSPESHPMARTAFRADLVPLASAWLSAGEKTVPGDFELDGPTLRVWTLVAGRPGPGTECYLLGLDPHAPETYPPLVAALGRAGLPARVVDDGLIGPVLRIAGRRRLVRLSELVGCVPPGADGGMWPLS